jgi:hypothetical protein
MLRKFWRKEKPSILDEPIAKVLTEMNAYGPDAPEYPKLVAHLERMIRLKQEESKSKISPDTMAIVIGNLVGILIIVSYEQSHVMVSKGVGFILRPKENRQGPT